jgi:ribosomal protein S6E (S10)
MLLSYKYRIEPNRTQVTALGDMLADFCQLYNAALEHRIRAYEKGVNGGTTHDGRGMEPEVSTRHRGEVLVAGQGQGPAC